MRYFPLFLFSLLILSCTTVEEHVGSTSAPLTMSPGDPLTFLDSGIRFPAVGEHIRHTNVVPEGQSPELNIARTTSFPTGNSTLQLGDKFHYYTTVVGQVASLSTSASPGGGPSTWYFLVRGDGIMAAQSSRFEVGENFAGGYAWELEPHFTGTTAQKYGSLVTLATIDMEREATPLQVRSGMTSPVVLTETNPDIGCGETALLVRRNVGGVFALSRVTVGDADSCGAGHRCLRVEN